MNRPTTPNYMLQTVRCRIPRAPAGEQQSLFVGLNQKNYLIPRGVSVELPLPVWEIVQMALRAEAQVDADLRLG